VEESFLHLVEAAVPRYAAKYDSPQVTKEISMPELPEVETARRGLEPHLTGRTIVAATLHTDKLRHPLDGNLTRKLKGVRIAALERRGKYLLLRSTEGTLILHLGMTGHLRLLPAREPAGRHDRMDLLLDSGLVLRFTDPRRFGTILWTDGDSLRHPLLAVLGPEPLETGFDGSYLQEVCRGRRRPVKTLLLDGRLIAGLGNIYAAESLFRAGIHPATPAGELDGERCGQLAQAIRDVLADALARGEAALPHFVGDRLKPGYFPLKSAVYGRGGQPCVRCGTRLEEMRQGGRSTVYCPCCQR
jgi:formamidopyrimidine-DNA glycosylase